MRITDRLVKFEKYSRLCTSLSFYEVTRGWFNTSQEFQLLSRFNEFELKMAEHADGSVDARLKLISKLDRELRDHYEVRSTGRNNVFPGRELNARPLRFRSL